MKLIIQIPCFNEEGTLALTLSELPRKLEGIDHIEILIVNDGSTDNTRGVARMAGAHHIISFRERQGLAKAFSAGLDEAIRLGADIIVNTDADNQYLADDIQTLIDPILRNRAEFVIGTRPIDEIDDFSWFKKFCQKLGSRVVSKMAGAHVPDATSGFRAFSRSAAMRLHVFSAYTYTLETIIQAATQGILIKTVPIRVNPQLRPSRLVKSIFSYMRKSALTLIRISITYRAFEFFCVPGIIMLTAGILLGVRFLLFYFNGFGQGHLQSTVLCGILIVAGCSFILAGLITDLIAVNRKLLQRIDRRLFQLELTPERTTDHEIPLRESPNQALGHPLDATIRSH
jgi:glycosyltransferase involved in cell wall biosynthesis